MGGNSLNFSPLGAVRKSVSGLNFSVPAMAKAVTIYKANNYMKKGENKSICKIAKRKGFWKNIQSVAHLKTGQSTSGEVTKA